MVSAIHLVDTIFGTAQNGFKAVLTGRLLRTGRRNGLKLPFELQQRGTSTVLRLNTCKKGQVARLLGPPLLAAAGAETDPGQDTPLPPPSLPARGHPGVGARGEVRRPARRATHPPPRIDR